jgi:hypothetical protein
MCWGVILSLNFNLGKHLTRGDNHGSAGIDTMTGIERSRLTRRGCVGDLARLPSSQHLMTRVDPLLLQVSRFPRMIFKAVTSHHVGVIQSDGSQPVAL